MTEEMKRHSNVEISAQGTVSGVVDTCIFEKIQYLILVM